MNKYTTVIAALAALVATNSALAFESIVPKITNTCPFGYRVDGAFCKPTDDNNYLPIVRQITKTCPKGFHTSGSSAYCIGNNKDVKEPIPLQNFKCPNGYFSDSSSGYCRMN